MIIIRNVLLGLAALAAAGCAHPHVRQVMPDIPLVEGEHGSLDQISVSDAQARATMVRAQVRDHKTATVHDNTFLDRAVSTEANMAVGMTAGTVPALITTGGGMWIANRKAKAIEGQEPSQTNLSLMAVGNTAPTIANATANTAVQAGADVAISVAGCGIPICP